MSVPQVQQIEDEVTAEIDAAFHGAQREKAKTSSVIALLLVGASIFSYLLAYCGINALVAAEMMSRWPANRDPRPKIFAITLIISLGALAAVAALARSISRRQLATIDEMQSDSEC